MGRTTDPIRAKRGQVPDSRRVRLALVLSMLTLVALTAAILVRRIQGEIAGPASVPLLVLVSSPLFLGFHAWLVRLLWRKRVSARRNPPAQPHIEKALGWSPTIAIVLVAVACASWPDPRLADWLVWLLVWLPIGVADLLWRSSFFAGNDPTAKSDPLDDNLTQNDAFAGDLSTETDQHIVQQLTRVRDEQGYESLYGMLSAELCAGERYVSLHIAFCPPLRTAPTLECEQIDGPEARVRVGEVLPYGARIDVRLVEETSMPSRVAVELAAVENRSGSLAAEN